MSFVYIDLLTVDKVNFQEGLHMPLQELKTNRVERAALRAAGRVGGDGFDV